MTGPATASTPDPAQPRRVVVVGAGPAGLTAAARLAAGGVSVSVLEAMPSPARKFLMAGRGGLNLTHSEPPDRFRSRYGPARARARVDAWLDQLGPADLISWAEGLGQPTFTGASGRIFPRAMKASPLLRAWLAQLQAAGVEIHLRRRWTGWDGADVTADGPDGPERYPADAVVLFDGHDMSAFENGESWPVADGVVTVGKGQIVSKQSFGDSQVHVEFRMPSPASGAGQGRGNSGIFLMGKYEIQVLDSFVDGTDGPLTYPDGQCGALYKQRPPAVNACRKPGEWQTYDILFTRPRFAADGRLEKPGRVSVLHNGIAIHSD
ncbi:MAG: NAD(P)/FAD-dependent oxidoreductase, partial [Caulobacter sp.]